MRKIGLITLIMLVSLSPVCSSTKYENDVYIVDNKDDHSPKYEFANAYMYIKTGQYEKAAQSIEKCVNHPDFYHMKTRDQAQAWLLRSEIYVVLSSLYDDVSTRQNALAITAESIQNIKQTDSELANEYSDYLQSVEEYIASVTPSNIARNGTKNYSVSQSQNSQWDVFNSISSIKRIDLVFDANDRVLLASSPNSINSGATQFWKANDYGNAKVYFTIYGDYSVSMSYRTKMYSERDDNKGRGCGVELAISGTGVLAWESERMVIRLNVTETVSGGEYDFYNYSANTTECHIYDSDSHSSTYTYEVEMSSINSNQIFLKGNDITSSIKGVKCFAGGEYRQNWYFHTKIKLANKPIRINVEHKSQSEMNTQNSDMYGKWQWNNDRSVIYLESTTKDARLVLWNNDGILSWGFQLSNTATGYKTETADSGQELAYLMLSFDGASEQSFSFVKSGNDFVYAQYDRFLGSLKHDASIINQIKDKRTLILNYKQNGSTKTAMFQLEGLEAIYNAITQ